MIGQKLSHYRILEQVEREDVGEVYLANDTDERRQVFLKIIPLHIRRDPDRMARIREDVEAASRVSHPHIAKTFTFEQGTTEDGLSVQFISMEYVRGRKLSEMIPERGFELEDVLPWLDELADALAAAHRAGVLHRDLRPSNIVITPSGEATIVGLGLARLVRPDLDLSTGKTPTRSIDVIRTLLQRGSLLDSIAYMAPEQAEGRMPSPASDVFSFGAIMYELFTGRRPFDGESYVELVSSILRDNIDLITATKPEIPYIMGRTVAMCLQKDPQLRYPSMDHVLQSIGEIRQEVHPRLVMEERLALQAEARLQGRTMFGRSRLLRYAIPVACLLAGSVITWSIISFTPPKPESTVNTVKKLPISILLPTDAPDDVDQFEMTSPVLSPDGRKIVYPYDGQLWLHDLSGVKPVALSGTEGGEGAFWAPGSETIGFFAMDASANRWTLRRVGLQDTGSVLLWALPDGSEPFGATWRASGEIVCSVSDQGSDTESLWTVLQGGGEARVLLRPDLSQGDRGYRFPLAVPVNDGLLFSVQSVQEHGKVMFYDGKQRTLLVGHPGERITHLAYAAEGYVVYQRESSDKRSLWALQVGNDMQPGKPFSVDESGEFPSIANDGTLLYHVHNLSSLDQLAWVDRKGKLTGYIGQPQDRIDNPALSPDGKLVAVTGTEQGNTDIWVHDVAKRTKLRVTEDPGYDFYPAWSPSGAQLAFSSVRFSSADIFIVPVSRRSEPLPMVSGARSEWVTGWSEIGSVITFEVHEPDTQNDIWYLPMKGNRKPRTFRQSPSREVYPQLTADDAFIAYQSDESGKPEIYVSKFPDGANRSRVSTNGGTAPRWSPNGSELFYVEGANLMSVKFAPEGGGLKPQTPTRLFDVTGKNLRLLGEYQEPAYTVSRDGQRVIMVHERGNSTVMMVQNWSKEFSQAASSSTP